MSTVEVAGDGVMLLYGAIVLLALSLIVFPMRVGVRVWRKAWGMDDTFMLIGMILFCVVSGLCITCSHYGAGQFSKDLPPMSMAKTIKLFYVAEYFYAVSAMFTKFSVAVALLRIAAGRKAFQLALWVLIGLIAIAALVFCVGIANICRPVNTLWGESQGKCNLPLNTNVSLFFSAIEILSDFSLSILPAILLWNVQMKAKVKASVVVMLALGSVASCATIVRLKYLTLYSDPGEFAYSTGKIGFWSLAEVGTGIIAGSLPALRPLLSMRIKVTTSSTHPAPSGGAYPPLSHSKPTASRKGVIMMDTFQTLGDGDDLDHSDGDSQKNIIKETKYTVTSTRLPTAGDERMQEQMPGWDHKNYNRA